ncbi:MAG: PIN domain-containing protein [Lachnospiraceae bacterium]|nr:PIN domain-containing protein [Lachnospiraceae bacterium]
MIHFLIDYENRNEYGLTGIRGLSENDHVYILFSQNACRLDLNVISETVANIHAVKVQPGRQSLDMHLVSCLGFLLNQYGTENEYYVISDDTDFDKVIEFWKGRGYKVSRVKSVETAIDPEAAETAPVPAPAKKKRATTRRTSSAKAKKAVSNKEDASSAEVMPTAEVQEITAVLTNDEQPAAVTEAETAEITVTETPVTEASAAEAAAELPVTTEEPKIAKAPAEKRKKPTASGNRKQSKPEPKTESAASETNTAIEAPAAAKPKVQPESVAINSRIQKFLAQNKVNGAAINSIASIVAGNAGKKDRKALIYRQIIKKFGQKEGLEYYKMLKSEL